MVITELTTQRNTNGGPASTSVTFTFPVAPSAGNLVVFGFSWRGDTTVSAVPFSCLLATNTGDGAGIDGAIYYRIASGAEGTIWTFTLAASNKFAGVASEWSGIHITPLDKTNSNTGSGTAGTTGATGTLTQADELVVTLFANINVNTWSAHDNGLAEIGESASTGGANSTRNTTSLATKITSATPSLNYGATLSGTQVWGSAVATFLAAPDPPIAQLVAMPLFPPSRRPAISPLLLTTAPPTVVEDIFIAQKVAIPFSMRSHPSVTVPLLLTTPPPVEVISIETTVPRSRWSYRVIWR